jgi:hypothetical protein
MLYFAEKGVGGVDDVVTTGVLMLLHSFFGTRMMSKGLRFE